MTRFTIARDDHLYACFPDVALTPDGTLVCLYRECMAHAPFPFSRIVVRRSFDQGRNWTDREIITEVVPAASAVEAQRAWLEADSLAGYDETRARITEDWQEDAYINCPRLISLADGTLLLLADIRFADGVYRNWIWRSGDAGATWRGPEETGLVGIVPSLTQLRSGDLLVGLAAETGPNTFDQYVCRSTDGGHTWGDRVSLPLTPAGEIDEVSYCELDDGTLVGFGRNYLREKQHLPSAALKVISTDGGRTWEGPFETWLMGCEGRPKAGRLRSGEICVTYRCDLPNEMLAMHVMTQGAARLRDLGATIPRQPAEEDIPARIADERGEERPWYMTSYYPGRTFILDCDRSVHRDGGYSGWVQLPDGDLYVVDYINDDAPLAQIRGYLVTRSDYLLFPEGDLPWLHPSWQPFRAMTLGMARRQVSKRELGIRDLEPSRRSV